jgi:chromosomal replication initiator protein
MERRPGASVAITGAEGLAEQCAEAEEAPGGWAELRDRLRGLDLLAVDDLPALARHPLAMAELGPVLDALADRGAAVAATASAAPGDWEGWPPRLLDRLRGGLAVRVEAPGEASRRRFVMDRARARGLVVRPEAVEALVSAADGYRPLEGRLARLALRSRVERRAIDGGLVEETLAEDGAGGAPVVPLGAITRAVAARFGVRVGDLRSADRHRGLVVPRHLAILLARELTGLSFASLGKAFGGRDTKTIRHACSAAGRRLLEDPALAAAAEGVRRELRGE